MRVRTPTGWRDDGPGSGRRTSHLVADDGRQVHPVVEVQRVNATSDWTEFAWPHHDATRVERRQVHVRRVS